jgi:lactoylglutathione lyase
MGTAYGHIALAVPDAYAAVEKIKARGRQRDARGRPRSRGGTTVIAFVTDPDGYKIELIQRAEGAAGGGPALSTRHGTLHDFRWTRRSRSSSTR